MEDAKRLAKNNSKITAACLDVSDGVKLRALVKQADIVVSLVPAPMHPIVAGVCISEHKHMITASYISPEMRALDQAYVTTPDDIPE